MKRSFAVVLFVMLAQIAAPACQSATQRENTDLRSKLDALTLKADQLAADNERLKSQVKLLTETTDNLTQVLKAQNALGTLPVASPSASPTLTPKK